MDKGEVIAEIRRLAEANGEPPGIRRFCVETGIREHEIVGRLWPRWGDALRDAGVPTNALNAPMDEDLLLGSYVALTRKLGWLPTSKDVRIEAAATPGFPHMTTFTRRYGNTVQVRERVRSWCEENPGNEDVLALCPPAPTEVSGDESDEPSPAVTVGYVYLLKSGRHYKIGRSNDAGRRGYEIRLQQPEPVVEVWKIKTDDPEGVEAYWHRRFAAQRQGGEWFALRKSEVDAFKRWRRIS